jgi:hypothetical protein
MLSRLAAILWVAALAFAPVSGAFAQSASPTQTLIDKISPSIVSVRVVLKIQVKAGGQSRSSESKLSTEGVVITPDGLIMMSNAPISSDVWNQMMGGDPEDKENLSISPTEFKVVIGSEQKEYSAFLAATDAKLGLAFIKIEDLADRKLTPVDFTSPGAINVGDQLAAVTRLTKGYDYAPLFSEAQVRGTITKPRSAYVLTSPIASVGLPVFTLDGTPVGVMVLMSASVDADSSGAVEMMMRFFAGSITDRVGIFLIPAATVQPIITEAITQAAKVAADRAKNPPAKAAPAAPTTSTKPSTK